MCIVPRKKIPIRKLDANTCKLTHTTPRTFQQNQLNRILNEILHTEQNSNHKRKKKHFKKSVMRTCASDQLTLVITRDYRKMTYLRFN